MINPIDRTTKRISIYERQGFFNDIPEMPLKKLEGNMGKEIAYKPNKKQLEERMYQHIIKKLSITMAP